MKKLSRRCFLGTLAASSAFAGCRSVMPGTVFGKPDLKFGVLSDVHVISPDHSYNTKHLIKAFECFRDAKVDGVLIAGDIADRGKVSQLEYFMSAWRQVFPGDKLPDGSHVEKLFIYGNHDRWAWTWDIKKGEKPTPAQIEDAIGYDEEKYAKTWEKVVGEKFEPIWIKTVKGYKFVGRHWGYEKQMPAFLEAHRAELEGAKPFFYTQHDHPGGTVFGDWAWGRDDGSSTKALSKFPNAVAFSGHSHYTLTDERTVWQGAFISINTSSMRYSSRDYNLRDNVWDNDHAYNKFQRSRITPALNTEDGKQGMIVSVYGDYLVIERREFVYDSSLGDDWIVPLGKTEFDYGRRSAKRAAPEFAAGSVPAVEKIQVGEKKLDVVSVTFPRASDVDKCRVFEYEVQAVLCEDGIELPVICKRVLAPDFHLPEKLAVKPGRCDFLLVDEMPKEGHVRFDVTPIECFGRRGRTISSGIVKL